jgi:hypothetical protein
MSANQARHQTKMQLIAILTLFIGTLGQSGFCSPVIKPHVPVWIAAIIITFPVLIVLTLTYFKRSLVSPRTFRLCLLLAMCWYALITIAAEVLNFFGYMPPDSPKYAGTLCRVLMHVGWISFIPLIRFYILTRRYELNRSKQ